VIDKYWVVAASSTATASCCGRPAENTRDRARRPDLRRASLFERVWLKLFDRERLKALRHP
jgi:hypothetical protein